MRKAIICLMVMCFYAVYLQANEYDWPQWRGPDRNGVDPNSPKLLDTWLDKGPKLVWKSDIQVPNGRDGGCGSVTVAQGRVFMMAHYNAQVKKISITSEELKNWGWVEGVPEDLAKKIGAGEGDFIKKFWGRKPKPEEVKVFVDEFLKKLGPEQAKKWGSVIHNFFKVRKVSWKGLRDLSTIQNKEFKSISELNQNIKYIGYGNIFHPHNKDGGVTKSLILAKCFRWTDRVYCLDAATGKKLWEKEFPGDAANKGTYYFAASCTPSVWKGKCYVAGSKGFRCLDVKNGSVLWEAKTKYSNSSPLILNGRVYIMATDLMCFDTKNGKEIWKQPSVGNQNSSVTHWSKNGKTYLIAITSKRAIFGVNADDGKIAWKTGFGKGANDCSPVIAGDILVARGYSGMSAYKLSPDKVEHIWNVKGRVGDRGSTPAVYKEHVYITGSMYGIKSICCIDIKTGVIKWKQKTEKFETTSPIAADGKVFAYVRNPKNKKQTITVMYKASSEKYEQLGLLEEPVATLSSPVIAGGRLYLRLENTIACYDIRK